LETGVANNGQNRGFTCAHCGVDVLPLTNGSYRNHCPNCLWSLHVDDQKPGDRASTCHGLMRPVEVRQKRGRFQVLHQCTRCGRRQPNRIAVDTLQPDDFQTLLSVARVSVARISVAGRRPRRTR
jgi:DNA-directed RNA polymerase subunit RPC12/RpoP